MLAVSFKYKLLISLLYLINKFVVVYAMYAMAHISMSPTRTLNLDYHHLGVRAHNNPIYMSMYFFSLYIYDCMHVCVFFVCVYVS